MRNLFLSRLAALALLAMPAAGHAQASGWNPAGPSTSGPSASQLPASLGAKAGAQSLSVVPSTDTPTPVTDSGGSLTIDTGTPGTFAITAPLPAGTNVLGAANVAGTAAAATTATNPVVAGCVYTATSPAYATGQQANLRCNTNGALITENYPATGANYGVAPTVSGAVTAGFAAKSSSGNVYHLDVVAGATALYIMLLNATSVPADGAVTPLWCMPIAANSGFHQTFNPPLYFFTGVTAVASTTGCYNKTASATAFLSIGVK